MRKENKYKVHLFKFREIFDCEEMFKMDRMQCGRIFELDEVDRVSKIRYEDVTCNTCKNSARYKELKELDKTMSEIKTEAEIDFKFNQETSQEDINDKINSHYNQNETPTIDKINEVLDHLEGKINNKQAAQIYNALKYWDRCEHKGTMEKDLFKCADSIHNAITGEFINEKG